MGPLLQKLSQKKGGGGITVLACYGGRGKIQEFVQALGKINTTFPGKKNQTDQASKSTIQRQTNNMGRLRTGIWQVPALHLLLRRHLSWHAAAKPRG